MTLPSDDLVLAAFERLALAAGVEIMEVFHAGAAVRLRHRR